VPPLRNKWCTRHNTDTFLDSIAHVHRTKRIIIVVPLLANFHLGRAVNIDDKWKYNQKRFTRRSGSSVVKFITQKISIKRTNLLSREQVCKRVPCICHNVTKIWRLDVSHVKLTTEPEEDECSEGLAIQVLGNKE
jgi:hypothetical protein